MPNTARFDDAIGALRYLQAQPFVVPDRVASFGWSQGGEFAMSVINGPTLDRARARGVALPPVGYAAAIAMYPGGCERLRQGAGRQTAPPADRRLRRLDAAPVLPRDGGQHEGAWRRRHARRVRGRLPLFRRGRPAEAVLKDIEQPFTPGTYGVTVVVRSRCRGRRPAAGRGLPVAGAARGRRALTGASALPSHGAAC